MLNLEVLILCEMLAAHHRTGAQVRNLAPDQDSERAIAARHGHLVAHIDLYKAIHNFAPGLRLEFRGGRGIAADSEGGLHWRTGPGRRRRLCDEVFSRS